MSEITAESTPTIFQPVANNSSTQVIQSSAQNTDLEEDCTEYSDSEYLIKLKLN